MLWADQLDDLREIEKRHAFGAIVQMPIVLKAAGAAHIPDAEVAASILLGALIEAATTISLAGNKKVRLAAAREMMLDLVDALAGSPPT